MNLKENINKIFKSIENRSQYETAYLQVRSLSSKDSELFEVLWPEAIKSQSFDRNVLLSALALYSLNLRCPIHLKEALLQMHYDWDISIEEVPWYLKNQFSKEEIIKTIIELNLENDVRGRTILYWLEKQK